MRPDTSAPADTRTMGIVHSALRRDLERARMVLSGQPKPSPSQRRAIADHVLWMMHFLHNHHTGEDDGLWPLIRSKSPEAGALLDQMEDDHAAVAPRIRRLEQAARACRADEAAVGALLTALADLSDVLLPHLRREELEMMPVVSATFTKAEYDEGLDPAGRDVVVDLVPAIPRIVLIRGFARRHRRKAQLLWGDGPATRIPSLPVDATHRAQ